MGTMSNLAQGAYIAHSNNYQKGRNGYKNININIICNNLKSK